MSSTPNAMFAGDTYSADDLAQRMLGHLSPLAGHLLPATLPFTLRISTIVDEVALSFVLAGDDTGWQQVPDQEQPVDLTFRWRDYERLATSILEGRNPLPAVAAGLCTLTGAEEDIHLLITALAQNSTDPLLQAYLFRGVSDRKVTKALKTFNLAALLDRIQELAIETLVLQNDEIPPGGPFVGETVVVHGRQKFVYQMTIAGGTSAATSGVTRPDVVVRFDSGTDIIRLITGEKTPVELALAGRITVEGNEDLVAFATGFYY